MKNKVNLISMTDFVLEQMKINSFDEDKMSKIWKYANFLKQPLELWMFVPCDEDGNVLEEPDNHFPTGNNNLEESIFLKQKQYQQAKERCLFDGFEYNKKEGCLIYINFTLNDIHYQLIFDNDSETCLIDCNDYNKYLCTIEDLVKYNLTFTETAIKKLGL